MSIGGGHHRVGQHRHRPDVQDRALLQRSSTSPRWSASTRTLRRPGTGPPAGRADHTRRRRRAARDARVRRRRDRLRRHVGRRAPAPTTRWCCEHGKMMVDLTPAAIGPYVVPPVNLDAHLGARQRQHGHLWRAGHRADRRRRLAGSPRSRTRRSSPPSPRRRPAPAPARTSTSSPRPPRAAIERVGGAQRGKAIIVLNPAEPPLVMRDTVFCLVERRGRGRDRRVGGRHGRGGPAVRPRLPAQADRAVRRRRTRPSCPPSGGRFRGIKVSVFLEVTGAGHYLPDYAGNLDIMTSAALRTAERLVASTAREAAASMTRRLRPGRDPAGRHARHRPPYTSDQVGGHRRRPRRGRRRRHRGRRTATGSAARSVTYGFGAHTDWSGSPRRRSASQRARLTTCCCPASARIEDLRRAGDLGVADRARRHPLHRGRRRRPAHRLGPRARHGRRPAS